jgi:hypothetical protein
VHTRLRCHEPSTAGDAASAVQLEMPRAQYSCQACRRIIELCPSAVDRLTIALLDRLIA